MHQEEKDPSLSRTRIPISARSSTCTSRESLPILMSTPRWKPWWPSLMCTASLHSRGRRRPGSPSFLQRALHKSNPRRSEGHALSRTIGKDQVVDEFIVSFTHDTQWDYLLPGIPPTGKKVELPHVVVMRFENGKVAHEHVWWDQASLLVQVGLLDPASLPVVGIEQAKKLLGVAKRDGDSRPQRQLVREQS